MDPRLREAQREYYLNNPDLPDFVRKYISALERNITKKKKHNIFIHFESDVNDETSRVMGPFTWVEFNVVSMGAHRMGLECLVGIDEGHALLATRSDSDVLWQLEFRLDDASGRLKDMNWTTIVEEFNIDPEDQSLYEKIQIYTMGDD